MSEMIERVAKAVYEARNGPNCYPWASRTKAHRAPYLADARAAIDAMREPTKEMVKMGVSDILEGPGISTFRNWSDLVESRYRMMIDAALKPSE